LLVTYFFRSSFARALEDKHSGFGFRHFYTYLLPLLLYPFRPSSLFPRPLSLFCLPSSVLCLLPTVYCLLCTVFSIVPRPSKAVVHHASSIPYCLLFTVFSLLPTPYYLLAFPMVEETRTTGQDILE
jgi:hypothetical protein